MYIYSSRFLIAAIVMAATFACSGCEKTVDSKVGAANALSLNTREIGLSFDHKSGINGEYAVPEIIGSGGALIDFDDDGDLDVLLINSKDGNQGTAPGSNVRLYRNNNGVFQDATAFAGFNDDGYGMGAAIADIDNDGDRDIYVTHYGPDRLYRNNGDGSFSDISNAAGIMGDRWSSSAVFFDFDRDGELDLFVASYLDFDADQRCQDKSGRREYCGPKSFSGVPNTLYRNLGNGRFEDISAVSGIGAAINKSLGALAHDFSHDGLPDIYVANDGEKNELWVNQGDGSFVDQAVISGAAYNLFGKPEASMGMQIGDINDDGIFDLLVTHLSDETNTLYLGSDTTNMRDVTVTSGLGPSGMPYTGFGASMNDIDLDGDLDVLIVNGRVTRNPSLPDMSAGYQALYGEPNQFFRNDNGQFVLACDDVPAFCSPKLVDRAILTGDVDADGDTDFFVTNSNGPVRFYPNDMPREGNWLRVRALLPDLNRDAIGAIVTVNAGSHRWMRQVTHTGGYLSGKEAATHFGIGQADRVDTINVRWPDGTTESFNNIAVNQSITVKKGSGAAKE